MIQLNTQMIGLNKKNIIISEYRFFLILNSLKLYKDQI